MQEPAGAALDGDDGGLDGHGGIDALSRVVVLVAALGLVTGMLVSSMVTTRRAVRLAERAVGVAKQWEGVATTNADQRDRAIELAKQCADDRAR